MDKAYSRAGAKGFTATTQSALREHTLDIEDILRNERISRREFYVLQLLKE